MVIALKEASKVRFEGYVVSFHLKSASFDYCIVQCLTKESMFVDNFDICFVLFIVSGV